MRNWSPRSLFSMRYTTKFTARDRQRSAETEEETVAHLSPTFSGTVARPRRARERQFDDTLETRESSSVC